MKNLIIIILSFTVSSIFAKDYLIYSIENELPMGIPDEQVRKNFYINMGNEQGLAKGSKLNVYRTISRKNPYDISERINYQIKLATIEVIHTESQAAIAKLDTLNNNSRSPTTDINHIMIGDKVKIDIDN